MQISYFKYLINNSVYILKFLEFVYEFTTS